MHRFKYKNSSLYCEDVRVADIAKAAGTPVYIYSKNTLIDHYRKLENALGEVSSLICFSVKSNSNLSVLKALVKAGAGLDIVSGGELYRARLVKAPADKIVYAGVGKEKHEILEAIRYGILLFNVESEEELDVINRCARSLEKKVNVAVRVNPDVEVPTHGYIKTGEGETKFGLDFKTAKSVFRSSWRYRNVDIKGVHVHIGSQILNSGPFEEAIRKVLGFIDENKIIVEYLNIGGGLGIVYSFEKPQTAARFAERIMPLVRKTGLKLIVEPGRFISGNSGILVTKVLFRKKSGGKRFVIVDGGMNDLIRPSLYGAYHEILPVSKPKANPKTETCDIVGPICESGDFLAKDRRLPVFNQGDLLAVMGAGAYGYTMSSNYNSRPRSAEVMVCGNRFYIAKNRETYKDLVRGEIVKDR